MEDYKKKRGVIKCQLIFFQNFIDKLQNLVYESTSLHSKLTIELRTRLRKDKPLLDNLLSIQMQIEESGSDLDELELHKFKVFENAYFELIAVGKSLLSARSITANN